MQEIFQLTIILVASLFATIICRRLRVPAVIGQMLIGLVLAPSALNLVHDGEVIRTLSEIGVILLMFLAGLEADLTLLRKHFKASMAVAVAGVLVPLAVFWAAGELTGRSFPTSFFYGIVFAATSVSITVEVLQEYGKLQSKAGSIILGAAVVDDILAVVLLSVFTSTAGSGHTNIWLQSALEIAFLGFLYLVHRALPRLWKFVDKLPIYAKNTSVALILTLGLSLLANAAGLSAVIGAFFAGIAVSQTPVSKVIEDYTSAIGYVFFIPIFFVSIALTVRLDALWQHPWIVVIFTLLAILTKFLPAAAVSRLTGLTTSDSLLIGTGMISRGEMALIVAQIGLTAGIVSSDSYSELVIVIILATLIAPFLIKATLREK